MTNKIKLIFPVLALGLILSGTAFAATSNITKEEATEIKTGTTEKKEVTVKAPISTSAKTKCISDAKVAKSGAIKLANDTAKKAKLDAKTVKDAAIKEAKLNADKKAGLALVKTANASYKKSIKEITVAQTASLKAATVDYKNSIKVCPVK